jgi:hypothetical protein
MNPLVLSAQHAAYCWYLTQHSAYEDFGAARRFARTQWTAFLPFAHEGWGKLLRRVVKARNRRPRLLKQTVSA